MSNNSKLDLKRIIPDKAFLALLTLLVIIPFALQNSFHYQIIILALFNSMICIGLNLLVGYTGQISLGHGAFAGLGAYITVILSTTYQWDPFLSLVIACIVLGSVSYFISKSILKLEGHYLAMATLAMGIIIFLLLRNESDFTGGASGMGVAAFKVFGYEINTDIEWYITAAFLLVFFVWSLQNIIRSPLGRILRSIRDSETATESIGVNPSFYKVYVFVVSVVIATIAGSLSTFYTGFIAPSDAGFIRSIELIVMIVFGGLGRIYGAVFGAFILTILPQILTFLEDYEYMTYGGIIILTMIFIPKGIVSLFELITEKLKK